MQRTLFTEIDGFNELKIEKVKLFTQSPTKNFCISIFNIGGCLAYCLSFRKILTLDQKVYITQAKSCHTEYPFFICRKQKHLQIKFMS